jgi:hypothetical protein
VYAAREKNGIYIPRDRYLHEEAEKKVPSECFSMNLNTVIILESLLILYCYNII